MEKEKNLCSDLIVKASVKRVPRFKPGSELSDSVNLKIMDLSVADNSTEDSEAFEISLHFKTCANAAGIANLES